MAILRNPNHPGAPLHPGEMLREEFMVPYGLTADELAVKLHVPSTDIHEIVAERLGMSEEIAHRVAEYFQMTPGFWMGLQSNYELAVAYKQAQLLREKEVRSD